MASTLKKNTRGYSVMRCGPYLRKQGINCSRHIPVKKKKHIVHTAYPSKQRTNCTQHLPVKKNKIYTTLICQKHRKNKYNTYLSKRNKLCTTLTCQK